MLIVLRGDVQRRQGVATFDVDIAAAFQQRLDDRRPAVLGRNVQSRETTLQFTTRYLGWRCGSVVCRTNECQMSNVNQNFSVWLKSQNYYVVHRGVVESQYKIWI